jgi:2-oxoglutarate ferredoxin oxidoreductase subunit beta
MTLTRKDFVSDQDVRWCPGCGDYSILAQLQRTMPDIGWRREDIVFISGIGCSSRLPYYMNTYGVHSIHGRAPTLATGLKAVRPELSVWVITGDGDGLSIGGNHLLHAMRRNLDLNIILFNNRIYGLTKGQYSPTSEQGKKTRSSPAGSLDYPVRPVSIALAAECTFVARSVASDTKHLQDVIRRAAAHRGTSFIEVYQNCNIFNDGAFDDFSAKDVRDDWTLVLEHGKPMVFGSKKDKGICLRQFQPETVDLTGECACADELLVHDEGQINPTRGMMLDRMTTPNFPVPVGVFRAIERETYDAALEAQIEAATARSGKGDLRELLQEGDPWRVE